MFNRFRKPPKLPADFSAEEYLQLNPDVEEAKEDPVRHYLAHGRHEGRPYRRPYATKRLALPGEPEYRALPLIVISFNRGAMLHRVIASYMQQGALIEVIVHDNGSTDPDTLLTLEQLERDGIRVFRRAPIQNPDELNLVNQTVTEVFASRDPSPYIVTDCDVDFAATSHTAIAAYLELLNRFPRAECVGPMLRIDDIRRSYPLFGRVMNRHIDQFWGKTPEIVELTDNRRAAWQYAPIDTTFAVHRPKQPFHRLKSGIRVYAPFDARHLDWYPQEFENDEAAIDNSFRNSSSAAISHWDNQTYLQEFAAEQSTYSSYTIVTPKPDGTLHINQRLISDHQD